jgi:RNA polymerase sigma-70 factor (ECF subfamily)
MTMSLLAPGLEPAGLPPRQAPAPPDAELVTRARRGDSLAFELVMRRHNRRLFRIARGLVWNDAEAEDVLQESYVRTYARLGELADGSALAAWLARIVVNEALGRRRSAARVVSLEEHRARDRTGDDGESDTTVANEPVSDQPDPERLAASGELRRLLETAVDALPDEFRAVFVLREVEGLSTLETAACLAIRPETARTRLHRARRLLQESLGQRLLPLSPSLFKFDGERCDQIVARVLARLDRPSAVGIRPALPVIPAGEPTPAHVSVSWLAQLLALFHPRRKQ